MSARRTFLAGAAAAGATGVLSHAAGAESTEPGGGHGQSAQTREMLAAISLVVATQARVRVAWRAPADFPGYAPIAWYAGRQTSDPSEPLVIWLNPDHPELISPRDGEVLDDVPLIAELLVASVDVPITRPDLGLKRLDPSSRRSRALLLAGRIAVIERFSPYPVVDAAEFERRRFAFSVIKALTPGVPGIAVVQRPLPADVSAEYRGRDDASGPTHGWGIVAVAPGALRTDEGRAAVRLAYVLATADAEPPESDVKRAYDAAAALDAKAGTMTARRAFAALYLAQLELLLGTP